MQPATHEMVPQNIQKIEQTAFDEIAFFIDNSQSMATKDTSTKASRFSRAQELIELILENIGGTPISLYTFSGDTELVCPQTVDYLYFRMTLRDLIVNDTTVPGTNFSALAKALHTLYYKKKKNLFIILSDGEDTEHPDNHDQETSIANEVAQAITDPSSRFNTIGIGSLEGAIIPDIEVAGKSVISKLHPFLIQQIAKQGRGHSFFETDQALPQIAKELYIDTIQGIKPTNIQGEYRDLSRYPALAALFFMALALIIPERRKGKT